MECGIVGLPNVGKSTLFNALTAAGIEAQNYPFCTIDPNVGVVSIPDPRLGTINRYVETQKIIPASLRLVDIAGLVAGASQGEGLGNKFLANIREVDAILHVVRCFEDDDITHVDGSIDPIRDIEVIELELLLSDMQQVDTSIKKSERVARSGDAEAKARLSLLTRCKEILDDERPLRSKEWSVDDQAMIRSFGFITAKALDADSDWTVVSTLGGAAAGLEHGAHEGPRAVPVHLAGGEEGQGVGEAAGGEPQLVDRGGLEGGVGEGAQDLVADPVGGQLGVAGQARRLLEEVRHLA